MIFDFKIISLLGIFLLLAFLSLMFIYDDAPYDTVKFGLIVMASLMVGLIFYAIRFVSKK